MARSSGRIPSSADKPPAEHVKAPGKQPRAVERPQVGDLLDHAQQALVAARVGADRAGVGWCRHCRRSRTRQFAATCCSAREQRLQRGLALLHQVQHRAPRRARAEPGKRASAWRQCLDFAGCHGHDISQLAPRASRAIDAGYADHLHGQPDFAVPTLDALVEAGHEVVAAYTQPPRPAGRGKADRPTAVELRAANSGSRCARRARLRDEDEQADFAALDADVAVVAAYGLILPQPILDAPPHGCLNVHGSLLPRWRGAAPIQRAIMAGDDVTGVTIMGMEAGLDTGPMLLKRELPIEAKNAGASHGRTGRTRRGNDGRRAGRLEACRRSAARGGRHLRRQDRQGRGAHRLARAAADRHAPRAGPSRPSPAPGSNSTASASSCSRPRSPTPRARPATCSTIADHRLRRGRDPPDLLQRAGKSPCRSTTSCAASRIPPGPSSHDALAADGRI